MAFFKFRTRGPQGNEGRSAPAAVPAESVESMRRRARHRLLGAAVLVLLGVIGFPLLFDTQPRPVSVDIPIEIPDRNKVKPLPVPATPAPAASTAPAAPDNGSRVASAGGMITETADGTEIDSSKPVASTPAAVAPVAPAAPVERKPEPKPEPKPERKPEPKPEHKPEPKPEPKPKAEAKPETKPEPKPKPAATADDGARARALLEGKPSTASTAAAKLADEAAAGRFVVQVGAFADADKAREVRQKLERAGLKTYVHVAKTADGERTRVRVGPFASRAEADRAAEKVKGLSLSAAILTL
ncbi:SPOR domain-containing protein [Variovorax sp. J22G73]|jgi:DedD protein|uniref:SPOR domain-containing protein n=1 Tax=unclassified Variovorax TaxID=663243 RepID=UPI000D5E4553|nr:MULTISPECIES: SPOR domain-containing protein [unclassified Variovorax]MDM0008107.1 SPOR domain-containing protein [Variovorax sp. J22R203]MDM0100271.1 SPOR domain-containing protein [Variovorax sp. J22G73]